MSLTNVLIGVLLVAFIFVSVLMCLVVLMQRSKQEGLGAAFGGSFTEQAWGAQTSQVLVKATVVLAALFFALSISLARLYSHKAALNENPIVSPVQQELLKPLPPVSTNGTPVTAPTIPTLPPNPAPVTPLPPAQPAAK
jgi:preprotein translocase subunit SecG